MVVIAILGILAVTAMPLYNTWLQRAYGSEAKVMMKKLVDGQIMYFLEYNDFFPEGFGNFYEVPDTGPTTPDIAISRIEQELKIPIPQGRRLSYRITNQYDMTNPAPYETGSIPAAVVDIWADFPLFESGKNFLHGEIYISGRVYVTAWAFP